MRRIDGDALLEYLQMLPIDLGYREVEEIGEYVKGMPTVKERKKGRWVWTDGMYACDQCHEVLDGMSPFCPMCGADMRKGEGEKEW